MQCKHILVALRLHLTYWNFLSKKIKHIHVVFVLVLSFSFLSFPFLCWILLNTCCVFVSICCFSAKISFVFVHFPLFQLLECRNTTKYGIQNHAFLLKEINILLVIELVLPISFRCCTLLNTCWILLSTCWFFAKSLLLLLSFGLSNISFTGMLSNTSFTVMYLFIFKK